MTSSRTATHVSIHLRPRLLLPLLVACTVAAFLLAAGPRPRRQGCSSAGGRHARLPRAGPERPYSTSLNSFNGEQVNGGRLQWRDRLLHQPLRAHVRDAAEGGSGIR